MMTESWSVPACRTIPAQHFRSPDFGSSLGSDPLIAWSRLDFATRGLMRRCSGSSSPADRGRGTMDEAFACPECGETVEIRGLAPGRQVRCGFCHRLLEVPYLPRVEESGWKRRRFGRPWWVPWAWTLLGVVTAVVLLIATVRFLEHQERSRLARSIDQLVASSRVHDSEGDLGQAVVDLDAAINLCADQKSGHGELRGRLRATRQDLARREARARLEQLGAESASNFTLGDWLNLEARVAADSDLKNLQSEVASRFQASLQRSPAMGSRRGPTRVREWAIGDGPGRLRFPGTCARTSGLHRPVPISPRGPRARIPDHRPHRNRHRTAPRSLPGRVRPQVQRDAWSLKCSRGSRPRDSCLRSSHPPGEHTGPTRPFRLVLELNESFEGNYMASENRLTRIDAHLRLFAHGQEVWQTTPTARTAVPLPSLPAYLSTRLALSTTRLDEIETSALRQRAVDDRRETLLRPDSHARPGASGRDATAMSVAVAAQIGGVGMKFLTKRHTAIIMEPT